MFAAVAAAQAVPKKNPDDFDTDEEASKDASDSPMVEEVAKAFLHSVDRYMEVNDAQPTSLDTSKLKNDKKCNASFATSNCNFVLCRSLIRD